ncbi:hypothetical protein OG230_02520 [Streptomyces sp. NBC_00234]|nr:hypothetical protein [Streptomyces sp. NBC_00234]
MSRVAATRQSRALRLTQPAEREPVCTGAARPSALPAPVRHHEPHRQPRATCRQPAQQARGGRPGPVQIVQEQDDGAGPGQGGHEGAQVGDTRVVRPLHVPVQGRQYGGESGVCQRDRGAAGRVQPPHEVIDRREDGLVPAALVRAAPRRVQDMGSASAQPRRGLGQGPRQADSGFTRQLHHRRAVRPGQGGEQGQLGLPAHEFQRFGDGGRGGRRYGQSPREQIAQGPVRLRAAGVDQSFAVRVVMLNGLSVAARRDQTPQERAADVRRQRVGTEDRTQYLVHAPRRVRPLLRAADRQRAPQLPVAAPSRPHKGLVAVVGQHLGQQQAYQRARFIRPAPGRSLTDHGQVHPHPPVRQTHRTVLTGHDVRGRGPGTQAGFQGTPHRVQGHPQTPRRRSAVRVRPEQRCEPGAVHPGPVRHRQGLEEPLRTGPGPPPGGQRPAAALHPEATEHSDGDGLRH